MQNIFRKFPRYELVFGHTLERLPEKMFNAKEIITRYITDLAERFSHYFKIARQLTKKTLKAQTKARFDKNIHQFKI